MLRIFYTGDVITPDGSDTGIYGDECEPGDGQTLESGWVDPDWSLGEVYADRDDVRPDEWTPDDGPAVEWLIERICARLGWIDSPGHSDQGPFYAAGMTGPSDMLYTGVEMRLVAHVEGATPDMLRAVWAALAASQRRPIHW